MNVRAMPIRRNLVIGELLEQQSSCKFGALSYEFFGMTELAQLPMFSRPRLTPGARNSTHTGLL